MYPRHRRPTTTTTTPFAAVAVAAAAALVAAAAAVAPGPASAFAYPPARSRLRSTADNSQRPALSSLSMAAKDGDLVFGSSSDAAQVLSAAFESLDESDKYDAVLTGLCAKLLDAPGGPLNSLPPERQAQLASSSPTQRALAVLDDALELLGEMTARSIPASARSLTALIDAAAGCEDPGAVAAAVSSIRKNGGMNNYGSLQGDVAVMPPRDDAGVTLWDGTGTTKRERLDGLPDVPSDDRAGEVAAALAAGSALAFCLGFSGFSSLFGMQDLNGLVNALLYLGIGVFVIDNFYDAIRAVSGAVGSASKDKLPKQVRDLEMPEKESLPLGLGSGALTGQVVRGFSRLLSTDTERECSCEAAGFFAAYALGLPCFAFRPNALEAAVLIVESVNSREVRDNGAPSDLDPLLSYSGVLKVLVWLMSPVAYESSRHPVLISSDPRECSGLLKRLREKGPEVLKLDEGMAEELAEVLSEPDGREEDDLLRWAYAESDSLLRNNKKKVEELTERLAGGAATVGDCVAALEGW